MANIIGAGVITIGADASKFQDDLTRETGKAGTEAGSTTSTALGVALGVGLARVAAEAGKALGAGFTTAMDTEVANMKFTQLFKGNTDKAKDFISKLQGFADRTPFDFPGLEDAAGRFLATGIEADKVIPIMSNLGDITSIMGTGSEGIKRATTALQQMGTKGKVTGEEMMQLTEAGIPGWDLLSESMGLPIDVLQDMVSKGLVPADKMFTAFEDNGGKTMSTFTGGMDKMSQTTEGKLSTMRDSFDRLAGSIVTNVLPAFKWLIDKGTETVKFFTDNEWAAKALAGVAAAAAAATVIHFGIMIGAWALAATQAMIHAIRIAAAWLIAMGPIGLIILAVVGLVALIIANLETIKGWISSAWDWITQKTYDIWNAIWGFFEGIWKNITDFVNTSIENVKGWIDTAWKWIQDATAAAWDKIKWFIFGPIGAVVQFVMNNLDTIKQWISDAWEWIKSTTSSAWNAVTGFIATAWDNIKNAVSERIEAVVGFARELPGKIVGALGDFGRLLYDKGKEVIQGLWDGMTEIWNKVTGWIGDIVGWIKEHKGPLSLDRQLLKPAGSAIMSGFEEGLRSGQSPILANLRAFTGAIGTIVAGRVSVGGKLLDTDTYARIVAALGGGFRINQGSWSTSVAASAGTHAGSGVVDLTPSMGWNQAVALLRAAGLDAWFRNWPGNQHIHLVNPNVQGLSPQALSQVASFLRGGSGLAGGYAAGTSSAMPGWGLVGERGPEWMRFRGGGTVLPNGQVPASTGLLGPVNVYVQVDDLAKMNKIDDFIQLVERSRNDRRRVARSGGVTT